MILGMSIIVALILVYALGCIYLDGGSEHE